MQFKLSRSNGFKAIAVLALMWAGTSQAVHEYYSISKSTRALGMGGAFYGLSDDEMALFYNPAGLSLYENGADLMGAFRIDGSTSAASAVSTIVDGKGTSVGALASKLEKFQGKPISAQIAPAFPYYLRRGLAVGLLLGDIKLNATVAGAGIDTSLDVTAIADSGLFIGFAGSLFTPKLHLGMNLKGMVRGGGRKTYSVVELASGKSLQLDVDQIGGAGFGIDADVGAIYEMPTFFEGIKSYGAVSINNIMATSFDLAKITTGPATAPQLPRMVSLSGRAVFPGFWKVDKVNAVVDLAEFSLGGQSDPNFGARSGSMWKHVNLGVELPMRWFTLRTGFRQGNITAGFGIDARFFQIDFATYAEELAANPGRLTSRRVALRLAMGFGGAKPAVEPLRKDKDGEKHEKPAIEPEKVEKPAAEKSVEKAPGTSPAPVSAPADKGVTQ